MNLDATIYNKLDFNKEKNRHRGIIFIQKKKYYDYNRINYFQKNY